MELLSGFSQMKVRITFIEGTGEEKGLIEFLYLMFDIKSISKIYRGRGSSKYSNIYIELDYPQLKRKNQE